MSKPNNVVSIFSKRDKLVLAHMPLVERIARQVKKKLPTCFQLDDLISCGTIGLLQAAADFKPAEHPGVPFGAFARHRIKGEMLESVRRNNWEEATRPPIREHQLHLASVLEPDIDTEDTTAHLKLEERVEQEKLQRLVDGAINDLPRREAVLIEMFYRGDLPIKDIAESADFPVRASRVSQIHTQALRRMRTYFELRGQKAA